MFVIESFYDIRDKLKPPFAMKIIILAAWSIWIIRNNKIFKNQRPSFQSWKVIFNKELSLLSHRMKKKNMLRASKNGFNPKYRLID
jgi:hypothetical protein